MLFPTANPDRAAHAFHRTAANQSLAEHSRFPPVAMVGAIGTLSGALRNDHSSFRSLERFPATTSSSVSGLISRPIPYVLILPHSLTV